MRRIDHLVVHCAATPPDWMHNRTTAEKVAEIRRWHLGRGWRDIGYHFVIDRDGTLATGRPVEEQGAHVANHNRHSIGICLIGGVSGRPLEHAPGARWKGSDAEDNFTHEQKKALRELLFDLRARFAPAEILGHRDFPGVAKACPSFDVAAWWALMPEDPRG